MENVLRLIISFVIKNRSRYICDTELIISNPEGDNFSSDPTELNRFVEERQEKPSGREQQTSRKFFEYLIKVPL